MIIRRIFVPKLKKKNRRIYDKLRTPAVLVWKCAAKGNSIEKSHLGSSLFFLS